MPNSNDAKYTAAQENVRKYEHTKTFSMAPTADDRLERVACCICGANRPIPHWNCASFSFSRCARCGHIYQYPRPTFDILRLRYDREYFEYERINAAQFLSLMLKGLADIRFSHRLAECEDTPRLLDVGCATGALVAHWQRKGWHAEGIEICRPAAEYGRATHKVPIHTTTLEATTHGPNSFDVIYASHVIEHVPDPRQFLEKFTELLAPRGLAVIVTPDAGGMQAKLMRAQWRSAIADHLNLFRASHLRRLMKEVGLVPQCKKSWGGLAVGLAPAPLKAIADRLCKSLNIGDVMIVVAQKL